MRRGVTLIEVLVAAAIGLMVLGLAWMLSNAAFRLFTSAERTVSRRESMLAVLTTVRRGLSDAVRISVESDGFTFRTPEGDGRLRLALDRGALGYRAPAERIERVLVPRGLAGFSLTILRPGFLRVSIGLVDAEDAGPAVRWASDDVWIPALGEKVSGVPWPALLEL